MKNKRNAAFTLAEILIVVVIIGLLAAFTISHFTSINTPATETTQAETDSEKYVDLNLLEQHSAEKDTNTLILVIISIKDGVKVEDHIEVLPDFPMNRSEKIATAKGFAVVKGYITEKEADKLVFKSMDIKNNVTVLEYYKPTKASM